MRCSEIVYASLRGYAEFEVLASPKEREEQAREWPHDDFERRCGAEEPERG